MKTIPISQPFIDDNDLQNVSNAIKSGWVSSIGSFITEFEERLAGYTGIPGCISVSNGTVGLHLCLEAFEIGEGDEVIVPNLTFAATINSVIYTGATPVIADCNYSTLDIDVDSIRRLITTRTRALIIVDLYGRPVEKISEIRRLCDEFSIFLIEDSAEALGAFISDNHVGFLADASVLSFYGNKMITTGEGGAVLTKDQNILYKMKTLRDHGMSKERRYWHERVGFNYRLTNMQAALGCSQLDKLEMILEDRGRIYQSYSRHLNSGCFLIRSSGEGCVNAGWLFDLWIPSLESEGDRINLIHFLKTKGIDTRPTFYPLSIMPPYEKFHNESINSISLYYKGICLPTYYGLSEEDIEYIANQIVYWMDQKK